MCPQALEYIGLHLVPDNTETLAQIGVGLRRAANSQLQVRHTGPAFLATVDAVEFHEPGQRQPDGGKRVRNVTTFGERTTDRSPPGTGTCPFPNGFSLMEPKLVGGWW
jgi:proline racemase